MPIAVLAVPDLFDSGLSAVLDILATANALRTDVATSVPAFDVTVTGTEAAVRTGHGLRLATTPLTELDTVPDLLVVPAVGCDLRSPRQVVDIVRNHPALAHVAALHAAGSDLAADAGPRRAGHHRGRRVRAHRPGAVDRGTGEPGAGGSGRPVALRAVLSVIIPSKIPAPVRGRASVGSDELWQHATKRTGKTY